MSQSSAAEPRLCDHHTAELEYLRVENSRLAAELVATKEGAARTERFQLLAETMPQLVWTCRTDGWCDYLGRQWVEYTGTPEKDQLGYKWLDKLHPDDRERANAEWARCAAAGRALDVDFRIRRADGQYRWFKTRALPARDAQGRIIQWLGTNTDIEDLRAAEQEVRRLTESLELQVAQRTAELRSVSERLAAATKAAQIGIWDWDVVNDELVWDDQMCNLHELGPREFEGTHAGWRRLVHPEDEALAMQAIEDALAGRAEYRVKYRVVTGTGRIRNMQVAADAFRDASGRAVRMLGASWDITAEVLAQEQIRINEERWNLALEGTGDGVWDWDVATDSVFLSSRSRDLLGETEERIPSRQLWVDRIHPDERSVAAQALAEHLRGESEQYECEYRLRRPDGSCTWVLGRGRVIARDSSGIALRVVGTHKDISERHRAQEALQSRERMLREFINHTPAAIAVLDRECRYVQASRRWVTDYKLQGQEIIGRSHYDVFPDIPQSWKDVHQRVLAGAVESCEEDPFPREDGGMEWLQWEARPWHESDGSIGGLIFFTQVITERKQLGLKLEEQNRQLLRSNEELEQFAYVASHDLQEPLRAIAGCTQILAQRYRGKLDENADELIAHVVDGTTRMKALIEDLLSFSRVNAQHRASRVQLAKALEHALANLQTAIRENGATVVVPDLPSVYGDMTQLVQLFQNLIGNALKYRGADPPRVAITATLSNEGHRIAVADNGIGIEEQYFERIFGVFQRLHTREEYSGTGIGLAVCRKIVERHGGRLWLESVPGRGSTFYFTLPR